MKIGEIILKIQQMNMYAGVMKKDNPKKFWLVMFRLIAGGLFFFTMFLHFWNGVNAFVYQPAIWLYIVVFVGFIMVYYTLEFSNNKASNFVFKLHTIFAGIHFTTLIWFVIDNSLIIRLWAFVQLLVIALMIILAWFPNLIMNLFYKGIVKPKKEKKQKKEKKPRKEKSLKEEDDIQDAEFVEIIDPEDSKE